MSGYEAGMLHTARAALPSGRTIPLFEAPYFLATKVEAFRARGQNDPMLSRDLMDIVAVLDGRSGIVREIGTSDPAVRRYLAQQFGDLLSGVEVLQDMLRGHLPYGGSYQKRFMRLLARPSDIAAEPRDAG